MNKKIKEEYTRLIAEHDKTLELLRKDWLAAKDKKEAKRWMERIDSTLDERLRLMELRDAP